MKDRVACCIYYVNAHADCKKGRKDVTLNKCKNCTKYRPRKITKRKEPIRIQREKDKLRSERKDF